MASPSVLNPVVERPASRLEQRVTRQPKFPFSLIFKPWQLQPVCFFPVLPGETMTSLMLQMQFWTDPLKANYKNTPWVFEWWSYYAKFRDLPGWETSADGLGRDLIQMIESAEDLSGNQTAAGNAATFCAPGGIDYCLEALKRIVECEFREDGQAWDAATADGMPLAHAVFGGRRDVLDRLTLTAVEDRRVAMPTHIGGELAQAYMDYAAQRNVASGGLQSMDYEDIVRAAGGKAVVRDGEREDLHRPELLGLYRHFDYPVNSVEPSTGVPAVAFGHRVKEQMRKSYRFPEFGWVVCLACLRPKALWLNQVGSFASMMQSRTDWFMASDDPNSDAHWKTIDDATGPLKAIMDAANIDYTFDIRQLLWEGEQMVNYAPDNTKDCFVTLPSAAALRDYPSSSDIMVPFSDTTNGRVRANGVIDVSVKTYPIVNPNLTQDDRDYSNRD